MEHSGIIPGDANQETGSWSALNCRVEEDKAVDPVVSSAEPKHGEPDGEVDDAMGSAWLSGKKNVARNSSNSCTMP